MLRASVSAFCAVLLILSPSYAKKSSDERIPTISLSNRVSPTDGPYVSDTRFAMAAANTTVLYAANFDLGIACQTQGWTTADISFTAQTGTFWHVDDFVGVNVHPSDSYAPIAGAKSLWCGVRAGIGEECFYATAPGYGRSWNQAWKTKACIPVTGTLDVFFQMHLDCEPGYDASLLEYTVDCAADFRDASWDVLAGGINQWDGVQDISHSVSYDVGAGPVLVRIRFVSDGAYSDDDGSYDSHSGPIVIDNLAVEGLAVETFEDEFVGETSADDWETEIAPGYGNYLALFPGVSLVQQDACAKNLSCVWAAIAGSSQTYACGGFPQQAAVPRRNQYGEYLQNAIVSPPILLTGTGSRINLQFSVYRDLPIDNLVFYFWEVRGLSNGCAGPWRPGNWYYGNKKDWHVDTFALSPFIDLASATHIQVRLGVLDACLSLCGPFGTGSCHSHAPLFDNVKVYRVDISGPMFTTRDFDMFQDTFPADGTDSGIGRADAALSITSPYNSPTILPGDSVRIIVSDPITAVPVTNPSGLATDNLGGNNGDKACYLYVNVSDNGVFNPAKSGAILSGGALYPFKDTIVADGKTWTRIQCWLRSSGTNTFVVDLNDNLFHAGDVVSFFFGATNTTGQTTYCSGSALTYVDDDVELAAEAASEFSILPVRGNLTEGRDLLLIDGMDGRGGQEFWDIAFSHMSLIPDRYDVRGPTSNVSNGPGSRVTDVTQQLANNYQAIFWETGDLSQTLGDGTVASGKSNDYGMVNAFMNNAGTQAVYLGGDDLPKMLKEASGASAITFRSTFVTYSLTSSDHRPSYGVSPTAIGTLGNMFSGKTWVVHGGCPLLNDFDVMTPLGTTIAAATYGTNAGNNAAVVSKITGSDRVVLSGYSFIYIRDDDVNGKSDRSEYLRDLLVYLVSSPPQVVGADPVAANSLEQNYPNPFNPATTIAFSIKESGQVRVDIYNVAGELVRTLVDEHRAAGSYHDVRWDGTNGVNQPVASGVYWYRLVSGSYTESRKMVLLK